MITSEKMRFYWEYFRTLCKRFDNTRGYIDHSLNEYNQLKYGDVCSWEFQQILILTAVEFENMTKQLCELIATDEKPFNSEKVNIIDISERILSEFPKIGDTCITTCYENIYPLKNWKIAMGDDNKEKIEGLDWWKAYNELKHRTYAKFSNASLGNCINALASLMVVELYLMKKVDNTTELSHNRPCDYFSEEYSGYTLYTGEGALLPDFISD